MIRHHARDGSRSKTRFARFGTRARKAWFSGYKACRMRRLRATIEYLFTNWGIIRRWKTISARTLRILRPSGGAVLAGDQMKRALFAGAAAAVALFALGTIPGAGAAESSRTVVPGQAVGEHRVTGHRYRKRTRTYVRGYVVRRGGYSYYAADSINTYGDSRSLYGGTQYFRHWHYDRQSLSGPFDHGFFFDSGVHPRGGDSPYLH